MEAGTISYAKQGNAYVLKFIGDIRYTMSCSLDNFLEDLFVQDDFNSILIDLTETSAIDSTNLGLLAKIANFSREHFGSKPFLVSTNANINQVLDSMGFDDVFERCGDCKHCAEPAEELEACNASKGQVAQVMLEAHNALCDISERNRLEFKNVIGALKSSLASI